MNIPIANEPATGKPNSANIIKNCSIITIYNIKKGVTKDP